jgi:hypothetical protein
VVLRDLDDESEEALGPWLQSRPRAEAARRDESTVGAILDVGPPATVELASGERTSRVAVVPAGPPVDPALARYRLERFTMDDYVLRILHDAGVYAGVPQLRDVPHGAAFAKLDELLAVMRANDRPVLTAKQVLLFLRSVAAFGVAAPTFAERALTAALQHGGNVRLEAAFQPLLDQLRAAIKRVRAGPS